MRVLYSLILLIPLTACASLSEDECRAGDWATIGFEDGAQGRDAAFIGEHREACAEYGIAPDLNAWLAGRERGLLSYCTVDRAYSLGRSGRPVANVCPATLTQRSDPILAARRSAPSRSDGAPVNAMHKPGSCSSNRCASST